MHLRVIDTFTEVYVGAYTFTAGTVTAVAGRSLLTASVVRLLLAIFNLLIYPLFLGPIRIRFFLL